MRSAEEVLRVVADSEYYIESGGGAYMCLSLSRAVVGGLISVEESYLAEKEIESYLRDLGCGGGGTLWMALSENSLPNDFLSRKAIYLDWNNRPKPWKRSKPWKEGGV